MATSKKFRSPGGGHVSIYVPWRPTPIEVPAEGTYETDDKQEIEALQASSEVAEYKQSATKPKSDSGDSGESKADAKSEAKPAAKPAAKSDDRTARPRTQFRGPGNDDD